MRLRPILSIATVIVLLSQHAPKAAELEMGTSEIRLDGTVRSANKTNTLVIEALSFSLPNGKGTRFPAPKPKNVDIPATASVHVRGDEKRILRVQDIVAGAFIIVIGKDSGSGKNLSAREVIVWSREENGKYFYGANPAPSQTQPDAKPPVKPEPAPKPALQPAPPAVTEPNAEEPQPAVGGEIASALDLTQTPILQIRVKTRAPNTAAPEIKLAPGVELPAALAKLSKPAHLFMFAFTTPDEAPENASATLALPAGLGRPSPAILRVGQPREIPGGMARPLPIEMYAGGGETIPAGQPAASEVHRIFFGYLSHQSRAPESYEGAATVALPVAPQRPPGVEPPSPPETTSAVGKYALQTSYAGNAQFEIDAAHDFLDALQVNLPEQTPDFSKPLTLTWQKLPRAIGYRVRALAQKQPEGGRATGVLWTSSRVLPTNIQDEQVFDDTARAVKDALLLNADTTSVTIPAGVLTGATSVTFIIEAFGPVKVDPGPPAVRIIPMSEKMFNLPFMPDEAGGAPRGRPARPRPGGPRVN
jgi:hypothetical protein